MGYGRQLLKRALEEARSRGLRRLEALVQQHNRSAQAFFGDAGFEASGRPLPGFIHLARVVHRAELLLWMGRYEEARAAFERSLELNRHTRWGWIGQLGNESFLGDPERALALSAALARLEDAPPLLSLCAARAVDERARLAEFGPVLATPVEKEDLQRVVLDSLSHGRARPPARR